MEKNNFEIKLVERISRKTEHKYYAFVISFEYKGETKEKAYFINEKDLYISDIIKENAIKEN